MNSISPYSIFHQNNPYESTIQQLLQVDGLKKSELQNQQQTLENKKSAVTNIGSKLTDLNALLTSFKDPSGKLLNPLSGQSSNQDAISVLSTSGIDHTGNYSISVSQLAKEDIVLSDGLTSNGSNLSSTGSASFTLQVGSQSASISVDTTGQTNREVMKTVADQVNNQVGDKLQASVYDLGDGTAQLSLKSTQTGKASRISISNVQGDAASLNLRNIFTKDALDAKFTIDNVAFERSTNKIDDAVQGLSFQLKGVTSSSENISITHDTPKARESIKSFIDKFNKVNSTIRQKTHLNADTGDQGLLQDQRSIRNLTYSLRQDASLPVASMSGKSVQSLADLGIELKKDGTMYIEDSTKLDKALKSSPKQVKQLFSADDGLANKLQTTIDRAIKNEGNTFDTVQDGFDRKIDRLDDRINTQDSYLDREEKRLRKQYNDLQQAIIKGTRQYNSVINFQSKLGL